MLNIINKTNNTIYKININIHRIKMLNLEEIYILKMSISLYKDNKILKNI